MDMHDVPDPTSVRKRFVDLLDAAMGKLGISRLGQLSLFALKKLKKDDIAQLLDESFFFLQDLVEFTTDFKTTRKCMKKEFIESQQSVIKLLSELLVSKNEQLDSLKTAV